MQSLALRDIGEYAHVLESRMETTSKNSSIAFFFPGPPLMQATSQLLSVPPRQDAGVDGTRKYLDNSIFLFLQTQRCMCPAQSVFDPAFRSDNKEHTSSSCEGCIQPLTVQIKELFWPAKAVNSRTGGRRTASSPK
ncbi:unnamed protein product [Periconia digitata]|uniref:Uncharacterized protein n=1 Tax=Periconia digitata TaxID=1303443 RepID=A0A9W4UJV7_9PLEO|nr:unnamed protein product [Periconia digitata]